MTCPECKSANGQVWEDGSPATPEAPAEVAGWRCTWCEAVYVDDPNARADYLIDDRRYDDE